MSAKTIIQEAVKKGVLLYLGKRGDRSVFEVDFFYMNPNENEKVFIVSNESNLENIIEEFSINCNALFACAYKEIAKED